MSRRFKGASNESTPRTGRHGQDAQSQKAQSQGSQSQGSQSQGIQSKDGAPEPHRQIAPLESWGPLFRTGLRESHP
jgi:hypothetical protein